MKKERYDHFFDRLRWAQAHGALNDRLGRNLRRILAAEPQDSLTRQLAETRIRELERLRDSGQLPPFNAAHLPVGQLTLGQDVHGHPIRIPLDWLCSGVLLVANTGAGKSNLLTWLCSQIAMHSLACSVWLFEPYKMQLRRQLHFYQGADRALVVLPWQHWKWNLLQSTGHDPLQHSALAVDLLVRTLNLPGRAAAILRQGIHDLYTQFDVWQGGVKAFPTLFDLYEKVRYRKDLNSASRDAILDRLGAFLVSLTPRCGAWRYAWTPQALARHSIVFEMRGCSEPVRALLPQSLLFSTFHSRIEAGVVNGPLELLIVFEDAQRLFDDARSVAGGEIAPLDELAGIIRGSGIGFVPVVQSLVGFLRRLRSNLALKIFGRLGSHEDYATVAADCGLNIDQVEYVRHHLLPGTFVGQVGLGRWTEPFLFRVPLSRSLPAPSESDIRDSLSPLQDLPTTFADEFKDWSPRAVMDLKSRPETVEESPKPKEETTLSESHLNLLRVVIQHPGKPVGFYCDQIRMSGKRILEIRKQLIAQDYIREHPVALKARGRAAILIEPLAKAHEAVRSHPEKKS